MRSEPARRRPAARFGEAGMGVWRSILLVAVIAVAATVLYLRYGHMPPALPEELESAVLLEAGPHRVASLDVTFEDATRSVQPNRNFAGAASRVLETRIWYPADLLEEAGPAAEPRPLLLYSHGFMSRRTGGAYMAEHLASRGYIVAAMNFPLTHGGAPGGPMIEDLVNQPADVSFVLEQLLARSADVQSRFHGAVDGARIGAFGLSLGGATTTLLAYHPRDRDERIRAALSIAGPTFMLERRFFAGRELPFMMLAGDIDAVVPYEHNAAPIPEKIDGALLVTLENASHTGFAGAARHMRWLSNPDWLACRVLTAARDAAETGDARDGDAAQRARAMRWHTVIGTPEEGVRDSAPPPLCAMDPLPAAMNPVHQHRLTTMAVTAFFESQLADSPEVRVRHDRLLREVLPREHPEVSVAP